MIEIRRTTEADHAAVTAVTEMLPDWFDEDARSRSIPIDLRHQDGFVALSANVVIGFVSTYFAEGRLQIGWLGVHPKWQRQGIGRRLVDHVAEVGREAGVSELATYTLGPGVEYEPYERTRAFYQSCGFVVYQTSETDNPGCPQEIRLKKEIG